MTGLVVVFTFLMAVFLNQANTILGINFSFSDIFCIVIIGMLLLKNQFKLLWLPTVYLILLIVFTLFTSLVYVPAYFLHQPRLSSVIIGSFKILVVFVYFLLGYSLSLLKLDEPFIKWYSYAALCIGLVGVIFTFFQANFLTDLLFYGGLRLKGLMNDPNYFSIVQISAIPYFTRHMGKKPYVRFGILLVFLLSILASGSKTGMIALLGYLFIRMLGSLSHIKIRRGPVLFSVFLIMISLLLFLNRWELIETMVTSLLHRIPSFHRIQLIFTDFGKAVSGMGSDRDTTWTVAFLLIQQTPVLGIGVGTYAELAEQLYGTSAIAHNTYLQLFSEWGILLSLSLFLYIFYMIGKAIYHARKLPITAVITTDILISFLIGSLAISLNNARMFWIFLGILVSHIARFKEASNNVSQCKGIHPHGDL